ncbi:MAG TPA: hypothetical protein VHI98_29920 [Vicinamibacterales bacterium]|jgi:hypothetical protein|nr:hypothetical protein [Vicinamibacterales bacterium]
MHPLVHRSMRFVAIAVLLASACSSGGEQQILSKFFDANRLRDTTTLGTFATVNFDRDKDGAVERFSIVGVSEGKRTPLKLREYAKAYKEAKAADDEFTKQKNAYQKENSEAISRVVRAEATKAKVSGKDAAVQATWAKWRQDMAVHAKKTSEARIHLNRERRTAEISTYDARRPIDIDDYDGDLVTKEVTIDAQVRKGDQISTQKLIVTMERAELKGPEGERVGRWIITGIKPA